MSSGKCSNYIQVMNNFIAYEGASDIRELTVAKIASWWGPICIIALTQSL